MLSLLSQEEKEEELFYSEISNIPQEFVNILCGGSKLIEDPDVRRHLCISGLVLPRKEENSQTEEFVAYDWNSRTPYAVSNPLMVGYYQNLFKKEMHLQTTLVVPPASVIDFVLTALPSLSFAVVVGLPIVDTKNGQKIIPTTALSTSIPHEVQYSQAFNNVLKYNYEFDATSIEQPNVGNVDCYIQHAKISHAIEWILASATQNSHNTHLARFELKPAYSGANHKCLVTIGTDTNEVKSRVKETDSKTSGVTIVGLVSAADHTTYDIYFKQAGQLKSLPSRMQRCGFETPRGNNTRQDISNPRPQPALGYDRSSRRLDQVCERRLRGLTNQEYRRLPEEGSEGRVGSQQVHKTRCIPAGGEGPHR